MKSGLSGSDVLLIILGLVVIKLLLDRWNTKSDAAPTPSPPDNNAVESYAEPEGDVKAFEESPSQQQVDFPGKGPAGCFPRDRLTADDLLPHDAANSKFASVNPLGQGAVDGRNYLSSTQHLGLDTVGSSLRNANRQIRSDPPIKKMSVGPWNNTTIGADTNRRPLEIGEM